MILSFAVFPASAAGEDVTLKITPDKTKIDTSAGDVVVEYTISVEVKDSSVEIGGIQFQLEPPANMTLGNTESDYTQHSDLLYHKIYNPKGYFHVGDGYTPSTRSFVVAGGESSNPLNKNIDLMTIKATIAKGATGSLTLGYNTTTTPPAFSKIDGTNKWSYTVETTPVTILKAAISSVSFTLDKPTQGAALPSLSGLGSGYTGAVEWYEGTSATGTTATGNAKPNTKYTAKITLTAGSGESFADSVSIPTDYTKVSADATTIVLTKTFDATDSLPAAIVGTAPTAKSLKYNGTEQELVTAGATSDGTMQYSLNNTNWSTAIPKGKDAKTYTVYYKVKGDSGHSDSTVANVKVTIGQKDISGVTIGAIANQSYTGSAITPDPVVTDGTTVLKKDKDYTVSYTNNTNAGTATLTINGKGNYTGTTTANFTITAVDQNPTFTTPKDLVKGGHKLDLRTLVQDAKGQMSFTISGVTSTYAVLESDGYTLTSTVFPGTVKINVNITTKDENNDGTSEYNAFSKSEAITVNVVDKPINTTTMKVSQGDITYGESVSPSVTNKPDGTDTVRYTYEGRDGTTYSNSAAPTNVGKYKVKATCESSTTIYTAEANFEILAKSISGMTVTLNNTSLEYNGSAQTVNVTGVGSLTAGNYTVTGATSGTDVGSYTVTVTGNGNYTDTAKATWRITPATLTVTPDASQSKKFNEADPALTYTYSGNASGQTPAFSGKLDREAGENVGTYAIKLGNLALKDNGTFKASNYTLKLSSTTVNFEIKKTDAPVPTGLKGVQNNELATVLLPTGWEWEASNTKMDTLGSHTFKAKYTDTTGNYNDATNVDVTVEVLAKTGVSTNITFPNGSLVYNGHGQEYKNASISGITAGGTPSWTYTYAVDPSTATATLDATTGLPLTVGKYKVTAIYEDSANYGTATATLEITPAKPTGTPTFTKITEKGKTLADAALGNGSLTPAGGKIDWVDDSDHVLPGNTKVEANKEYKWRYTPASADAVNYAPVYGTIVVYPVSTGIVIYSPCYTIKASAGANGSISPAGWCSVVENGSQTFTFTPDKGYTVAKVLVDGKSVGAVKSYTFKNVTKDHTIEVIFMKSNGNPATGVFVMP